MKEKVALYRLDLLLCAVLIMERGCFVLSYSRRHWCCIVVGRSQGDVHSRAPV